MLKKFLFLFMLAPLCAFAQIKNLSEIWSYFHCSDFEKCIQACEDSLRDEDLSHEERIYIFLIEDFVYRKKYEVETQFFEDLIRFYSRDRYLERREYFEKLDFCK